MTLYFVFVIFSTVQPIELSETASITGLSTEFAIAVYSYTSSVTFTVVPFTLNSFGAVFLRCQLVSV